MKNWTTRWLSVLTVAALFASTGGEALGMGRPCAHHEAAAAHGEGASEAGTGAHHAHAAQGAEDEGDEHAAPCSCLGNCTVVAPAAMPHEGVERPLPVPGARVVVRPSPVAPVVMVLLDHMIPLPNAPPIS